MKSTLLTLLWIGCCYFDHVVLEDKTKESGQCQDGSCEGETFDEEHEKVKYSAKGNKWQKYLDLIEEANKSYKECSTDDCYKLQRRTDFKEWAESGITKELFVKAKERNVGVHYQILDGKLYRQENCIFEARCNGNEHFILKIVKHLPNMEFIINTHDSPKVRKWDERLPVFSFSKTPDERDILYPAWSFWEGGPAVWPIFPTGLGRWDSMSEALDKTAQIWSWERKHSIAFFRGSRTSHERDPLILLSRDKPHIADARYTKNQSWRSKKDSLDMEPVEPVTMEQHCHYKYLFNFRGVAASFRFKHLFLCKSLVFHVGDDWIEFFYGEIKPWVHYIPLSVDLKDVEELIEFARENDDVAQQIMNRGHDFIDKHLRMTDVENYWLKLLKRYSNLAKWKVTKDNRLKEIIPKKNT